MCSPLRAREMTRQKARTSKEIVHHYTESIQCCSFPILESYCYNAYKPWSKSNQLSNKHWKTYRDRFSPLCPQTMLLTYERANRRKVQEDNEVFKREPTSNVDYNQEMEMEMEMGGLDGDEKQRR
jgi:hypothetical protein